MVVEKKVKKKRSNKEEQLQVAVSAYIRANYPDVIFTAESSGVRMNIGQAMKLKAQRSEGKLPDLIILEPRGQYTGLVLELKQEGAPLWLKNGTLSQDEHIQGQFKILKRLSSKSYYADFTIGYKETIETINRYMAL